MEKFTITLKVEGHRLQTLTEKDGLSTAKELVLSWFYMLEHAAAQQGVQATAATPRKTGAKSKSKVARKSRRV